MTYKRQQQIYSAIFSTIISVGTISLPLDVEELCSALGIELCRLSDIIEGTGLSSEDVFHIWGNMDGVCMHHGSYRKIAYNDYLPHGRTRFTICEEIAHFIIGHTKDQRFNIFDQQYDPNTYKRYEEEARMGAGLLLCQPQYFYRHTDLLTPSAVAYLCDITSSCAKVRCDILARFKRDIIQHPLFYALPQPELQRKYKVC